MNNDLPAGYLLCNGAEVSISDYPDLYVKIGNICGTASDTDHFVLPDLRGRFLEGTDSQSEYIEAGLPNIKGSFYPDGQLGSDLVFGDELLFKSAVSNSRYNAGLGQSPAAQINFNASDYNPIYSDDVDTVQPASFTLAFIIKAYSDSSIESQQEYETMNADTYLNNSFTIIYPNGGTEESPANITNNTRYVENNPFPGYIIRTQIECIVDGDWVEVTNGGPSTNPAGAYSSQLNDTIVIQTLRAFLVDNNASNTGMAKVSNSNLTTAPCRLKVWKIGKIES